MDRTQAVKIAESYARQVKSYISPDSVILYGSYAKGNFNADSDIDIAIVFDKFDGDYWETIIKLHEMTLSVDTRIEPVLLENANDPSGFIRNIQQEGLEV